jgi:hypothetical protein
MSPQCSSGLGFPPSITEQVQAERPCQLPGMGLHHVGLFIHVRKVTALLADAAMCVWCVCGVCVCVVCGVCVWYVWCVCVCVNLLFHMYFIHPP